MRWLSSALGVQGGRGFPWVQDEFCDVLEGMLCIWSTVRLLFHPCHSVSGSSLLLLLEKDLFSLTLPPLFGCVHLGPDAHGMRVSSSSWFLQLRRVLFLACLSRRSSKLIETKLK